MAALTKIQHASRALNRHIGVGFWTEQEAIQHARLEQVRTGRPHDITSEQTPGQTHRIWFVKKSRNWRQEGVI